MVTLYMLKMHLYGTKRLEKENNGRAVFALYKFLAGHKRALGGPLLARRPSFAQPCFRSSDMPHRNWNDTPDFPGTISVEVFVRNGKIFN